MGEVEIGEGIGVGMGRLLMGRMGGGRKGLIDRGVVVGGKKLLWA